MFKVSSHLFACLVRITVPKILFCPISNQFILPKQSFKRNDHIELLYRPCK